MFEIAEGSNPGVEIRGVIQEILRRVVSYV